MTVVTANETDEPITTENPATDRPQSTKPDPESLTKRAERALKSKHFADLPETNQDVLREAALPETDKVDSRQVEIALLKLDVLSLQSRLPAMQRTLKQFPELREQLDEWVIAWAEQKTIDESLRPKDVKSALVAFKRIDAKADVLWTRFKAEREAHGARVAEIVAKREQRRKVVVEAFEPWKEQVPLPAVLLSPLDDLSRAERELASLLLRTAELIIMLDRTGELSDDEWSRLSIQDQEVLEPGLNLVPWLEVTDAESHQQHMKMVDDAVYHAWKIAERRKPETADS
jgi:hypothetical protein